MSLNYKSSAGYEIILIILTILLLLLLLLLLLIIIIIIIIITTFVYIALNQYLLLALYNITNNTNLQRYFTIVLIFKYIFIYKKFQS